MAIRYDSKIQSEIRKTVKNFNAKISRLEKQGRELIPNKVSVQELKDFYTDRKELQRKLKQMRKFSTRGIEDIVKTSKGYRLTKYDLSIIKQERTRAIRRSKREIKRLRENLSPLQITRKSALNLEEDRLRILQRDVMDLSSTQLQSLVSNINRELNYDKKTEQFQENFFNAIFYEAGVADVESSTVENIQNTLAKLTPDQLLKLYKEDPNINALMDYSPTKGNYISSSRLGDILRAIEKRLPSIMQEFNFS